MPNLPITLLPPNETSEQMLGFYARSIRIDNPTSAYWYLPDQMIFIPPFVSGKVLNALGTQRANIRYAAPPGLYQPDVLTDSAAATFIYSDDIAQGDSGLSLAANAFGRGISIIPIKFSVVPGISYTFVQPAPDGFTIQFDAASGSQVTDVEISLQLPGDVGFTDIFQAASVGGSSQFDDANTSRIRYKASIPTQSTIHITGTPIGAGLAKLII